MKYNLLSLRLIACSFPVLKGSQWWLFNSHHTEASLAMHLNHVLDRVQFTDSHLLDIITDNASAYYSGTHKLQSTLEESRIEWPASRNQISWMPHVIRQALTAFMSILVVKGRNKFWKAPTHNKQFAENESIAIGKSQRLQKEGNARTTRC